MNESHEAGAGRGTVMVGPDWAQDVWCDYRNYGHFIAQCERRWQAGFRPHLGGKDKDELLRLIRVYQGRTYGKAAPPRTGQRDASGFANNVRAAMAAYQEGDVSQGESHHTTATGVTGMSATLNDMTPEALRDLAARASATANEKEREQAEAKRKAEKDIIPPPGTFWRYNKRVWTVIGFTAQYLNVLVSVDENGNDVRYWFMGTGTQKFSTHKAVNVGVDAERWLAGGHPLSGLKNKDFKENRTFWEGVGRLVLTARDIK